jgi:hypothetical protein
MAPITRGKSKKVKKYDSDEENEKPVFNEEFKKELKFKDPRYPTEQYYSLRYTGMFNRQDIKDFAQNKSNGLKKISPGSSVFQVSLKFADGSVWRSGKRTAPGEPVSLWDPKDSDTVDLGDIVAFDIIMTLPIVVDRVITHRAKPVTKPVYKKITTK